MLHLFGQRGRNKFCEQERVHSIGLVFNLLKVFHFINTNKTCWTRDVADSLKQNPDPYRKVEIGMYFLSQGRYIVELDKDKYLGKSWGMTNKGRSLLDRYAAFLREEQRIINYKIKESHKISREMKENE